jgi:O-antigen/teichoic acid export membrane protein
MINKLKIHFVKYSASDFLGNVSKLVTGTAFSQLILLAATPILYRLYAKEDFGTLGLYLSVITVIGSISGLQYTQAILLEEDEEDAFQILCLAMLINLTLATILFCIMLLIGKQTAVFLKSSILLPWLIFIPLSFFVSGQTDVLRVWANRKKRYDIMSWSSVLASFFLSVVSVLASFFSQGSLGLFLGLLVSQVVPLFYLGYVLIIDQEFSCYQLNIFKAKKMSRKYLRLPVYLLPTAIIGQFNNQLPLFILNILGGPIVVGIFSLCVRVLGLPSQLLSNSVGEVFKQRATEDFISSGNFHCIFTKTFKVLLMLSIIPFVTVLLFGPYLFSFAFGEKWRDAGVYSQVMAIMFLFRFSISPLTYAYYIRSKQIEDFCLHIALLVGTILTLYYGSIMTGSTLTALLMYSVHYSLVYGVYFFRSYNLSINR